MIRSLAFAALLLTVSNGFGQEAPPATPEPATVPAATPESAPALPAAEPPPVPPAPATPAPTPSKPPITIEIDLTEQKAWILQDGQKVYETAISTGRSGHETRAGNFTVVQKDEDHKSSLYGKIVDAKGRVLVSDADSDMAVPAGAKFAQAPMKYFLRFDGAIGMHGGRLPGYPASHGCVRLPHSKAALFFNIAEVGTPVRVFGKAPQSRPAPKRVIAKAAPPTPAPATPKPKGFLWFGAR
jgi:lipoprotein-anchoring transpeptidase ErfK/SrfK